MTLREWRRISGILAEALALPAEARPAFLDRSCGGNPGLRAEVEAMLQSEDASAGPVEQATARTPIPGELPGGWRLLERLGEGGAGAVHRAERKSGGLIETAAVKLLPVVQFTPELLRRMESERRILAGWQHPNIARLLEGGSVDGIPFFVMEMVEGQSVADFCKSLPVRKALELFLKICAAVSFAHQRLVLHLDIKPSNILVTREGEPKLLDFGIAQLLAGEVDPGARNSANSRALSTGYASPEQLRGEHASTAADVYSLGVLLFELLAGQRRDYGQLAASEAVAREIEETAMLKPSAFRKGIAKDLDAIVEKATRPAPGDRYASVEQLSEDIRRHLEDKPVKAREGSWRYRFSKFVARNKLAAAVCVMLLAALGAFVWASWQTAQARSRAEAQLSETRAIAGMMAMYIPGHIINFPESLNLRRKMAAYGLTYLDQQSAERDPADARQRKLLAFGYYNLGNALGGLSGGNLGEFEQASQCYRKALDLFFENWNARVIDPEVVSPITLSLTRRVETLLRIRRPADALRAAEECIVRASQMNSENADRIGLSCRFLRLQAMVDLGRPITDGEMADLLRRESELGEDHGAILARTSSKHLAAQLSILRKDYSAAIEYAKSGLDLKPSRKPRAEPVRVTLQRGRLLMALAAAERELGEKENASARLDECFDVLRELIRSEPGDVEPKAELARALLESITVVADESAIDPRLREAESLARGILKEVAYPNVRFLLVRILAAQADRQNDCQMREQALREYETLVTAQRTLPSDAAVIDAIRQKRCPVRL